MFKMPFLLKMNQNAFGCPILPAKNSSVNGFRKGRH